MAIPKSPADSVQDVLRDPELQRVLTSPEHQGLELAHSRQIYTNRALKMDEIALVGFDMDYTLAVYSMRQIEELAFHMTLGRMVQKRGYPDPLTGLKYDHEFVIRGLVVDKDFGNIFKMDRHNHVGRCYHGRRPLSLDGRLPEYPSWRNYFDYVVVGAQKPAFFAEHRPFVELNPNGTILKPQAETLERGKLYEGGNLFDFERLTGFAGEHVLYVGDHIYGDIIRNRKASQWRTCFVVQELEQEIEYIEAHAQDVQRLNELDALRTRLDDMINHHKLLLNALDRRIERGGALPPDLEPRRIREKQDLEKLRRAFKATLSEGYEVESRFETGANAYWGLVFKEGNENSRFGEQVEDYADLYTSRVSNFLYYSPMQVFRSPRATMAHERVTRSRG